MSTPLQDRRRQPSWWTQNVPFLAGLVIYAVAGIYQFGIYSQKMENLQNSIADLKADVKELRQHVSVWKAEGR